MHTNCMLCMLVVVHTLVPCQVAEVNTTLELGSTSRKQCILSKSNAYYENLFSPKVKIINNAIKDLH